MKKIFGSFLAIALSLLFVFQSNFVALADEQPDWQDVSLTRQEFNEILNQNQDQISTYTSGLILTYKMAISNSGSTLLIAGRTICDPDVSKCGLKVVTIKRRKSSTASWSTYKTYEDLYVNTSSYSLSKALAVTKGYQYKVYCTHYAKKNLFSTEKIENSSNVVAIS